MLLIALIAIFYIVVICYCSLQFESANATNAINATNGLAAYQNGKLGISFEYPERWSKPIVVDDESCFKDSCSVSFNIAPNIANGQNYILGVRVNKLSSSEEDNTCSCDSLLDYVKWDYNNAYKDQAALNDNQTTIRGNLPAWQMELLNNENGYKTWVTWVIHDNLGYRFLYTGANDNQFGIFTSDFKKLLASVKYVSPDTSITQVGKTPSFLSTTDKSTQSEVPSLKIPSLNESARNAVVDNSDEIAIKMKFGKGYHPFGSVDMTIYGLKDQNFVVSDNSRICPDQNCKFEFKDTDLVYQPGSNDITLDGTVKVNTGDVTKINKFSSRLQPTEAREQNGVKTEIVQGTFGIGKEPVNGAEIEYNVNGTLESQKGGKILSLQGVQCNGINNDNSKTIDCNY